MNRSVMAWAVGLALAAAALVAQPAAAGPAFQNFDLGHNAEGQACYAQWRFVGVADPTAIDLYCGAWERPSGELQRAAATGASGLLADFEGQCSGETTLVSSTGTVEIRQVACRRKAEVGVLRLGLIMRSGDKILFGLVFPSDWGPGVAAGRVLLGLDRQVAMKTAAPGLDAINQVFPAGPPGDCEEGDNPAYHGPPGRCADQNYQVLRERAFEHNMVWSFGAAERDFSVLLSLHDKIAPDDVAGKAEILSEIGVNLSAAQRAQEATQFFDDAEALANQIHAVRLVNKIGNYRALAALDARDWVAALRLAKAANDRRAAADVDAASGAVSKADAERMAWEAAPTGSQRLLLTNDEATDAERDKVLRAQADFIQAVATDRLRQPGWAVATAAFLRSARVELSQLPSPPDWLVASILEEDAHLDLTLGRASDAVAAAEQGVKLLRETAPNSRGYAHLLFTLADARAALGQVEAALTLGRAAVKIVSRQSEAPGFPADLAVHHIERLQAAWAASHDTAIAEEYFQSLSLVWGGAAAHTAAQLAARLSAADQDGSDAVRDFQDAERAYRAALARQERLASNPAADPAAVVAAKRAFSLAARTLAAREESVRRRSPRYLDLLHPLATGTAVSAALAPDEAYVRLVLADGPGFGVVITHSGVFPYRLDITRAQANAAVLRLRDSLKIRRHVVRDYDLKDAEALYQALLAPAQAQLAGTKVLHLDAGDVLASLPFAALVVTPPTADLQARIDREQDYRGVDWLARRFALDVALGPATFLTVRANAARARPLGPLTAFGDFQPDPHGVATRIANDRGLKQQCLGNIETALSGLPALPETAGEVATDAKIFGPSSHTIVGKSFTDTAFLSAPETSTAGVLVLATHGVLGLSDCFAEPALLASLGPTGDGLITATAILGLRLQARLVVLSACDTAGGGRTDAALSGLVDGGEALSGLARSFLYAGSTSVLATQWKAASEASGLQTNAVLKALKAGEAFAPAVAKAQGLLFEDKQFAHPFFWASFVLLGDGASRLQ